jgi:ABC-type nitrate/sulfonate/bicarbonate transport system substrate-binding protein
MEGGSVQFAGASPTVQLLAAAKGSDKDVVSIESNAQGGGGVCFAPIKNKSRGTGLAAFKNYGIGSTWGVPSIGGIAQVYLDAALENVGVDYSKVTVLSLGSSGVESAVEAARVDIGCSSVAQGLATVQSGKGYLVWYASGQQSYNAFGYVPESSLMTTKSYITQSPKVVQAIVTAEVKANFFLKQNVNDPAKIYTAYTATHSGETQAAFVAGWPYLRAEIVPTTGLITDSSLVDLANFMKKYKFLSSSYQPAAGLADTSFVANAYKSLGKTAPTQPIDSSLTQYMGSKYVPLG